MHQKIRFYLRYHTHYGQELYLLGNIPALGNDVPHQALRLQWENDEWWTATIHINTTEPFVLQYQYIFKELEEIAYEGGIREILLDPAQGTYHCIDSWNYAGQTENAWQTAPFTRVFFRHPVQQPDCRKATHQFRVQAPLLPAGKTVCLLGNIPSLGSWNIETPLLLQPDAQGWFTTAPELPAGITGVRYKYGVYDLEQHTFECYENGADRELPAFTTDGQTVLHDGFARLHYPHWKGTGVSVPVFSLRSAEGFGTGEFADLAPLAQWAQQGGLQLIQLLPVNDTISTWTWRDSYPYSAISSFALHPLYIRLQEVGTLPDSHPLQRQFHSLRQWLNEKDEVDYETVLTYKMAYLKAIYDQEGEKLQTRAYWQWFAANEHWLLPYAVFCYLRDKYHTPDFSRWPEYNEYDYTAINELVITDRAAADTVHFYFFVQYHLHLQLQAAVEAVHSRGIALKGDIPIGISRHSADAWMNPGLYHLDMQAGAPPDSFTAEGQNWGFPTYNWKKMAADGCDWWQQRLRHMSVYFDAFRIDHILGFFRIWQIPQHAVQGLLGYFHPAIPVSREELLQKGIAFEEDRFCQPWITESRLDQLFGSYAGIIKDHYLQSLPNGRYSFQPHCDTQRKIRDLHLPEAVETALFLLIADVLLIKVTKGERVMYHPRYDLASTTSFAALDPVTQERLQALYQDYFYVRQESCWRKEAMHKLPLIRRATRMLICGEDLGMVPHCVPGVMQAQGILGLEVQRMPKHYGADFAAIFEAPYLSVLTPSTHDMSTLRGWWEEHAGISQKYYRQILKHNTPAPPGADASLIKEIINQHLQANAMWRIFQIQDLLAAAGYIPQQHPDKERINIPAVTQHYWRYRINKPITDYELRKF
ncbi:4-alpha-glucanotransferase [Chitinophaga qingshengii]|uniref:4-alpha-glucanotransferase n=1 Tax=Chitinophaga qingshengii TaxID=1569794 RepID=A0ABR7TL23_9BACT|nr:4-alpha-glucanotransferase [Chitinophaga qingshengii]MBC9930221.1 4-alpha-glucanotransferase [Chitinophaga qingshengii]